MLKIQVENIKCGGCASSITKKINSNFNIDSTEVEIENGVVIVDIADDKKQELIETLFKLGYPETGSVEGIKSAKAKAKSFVSCAIGQMTK